MNKANYEKLVKSLERLKEQYENYTNEKKRSILDEEGVKESVIRRFEICNDTLWKHLKKYLTDKENLANIPNSPNGIFRTAYKEKFINEKMFERLINYNSLRCIATYDLEKVKLSLNKIGDFIQDADKIVGSFFKRRFN